MLSYTTEFMYAQYNSDKLFFMLNTVTEIIPATGEARFAVNLEEWLGNGVFTKSVFSPYFLNGHQSFCALSALHSKHQTGYDSKGQ